MKRVGLLLCFMLATGCNGGDGGELPRGVYESANPGAPGFDGRNEVPSDGSAAGDGDGDGDGDDAERAIAEADIVNVQGDRLYALSAYGGLSVIDVSDPNDLRLLGRHKTVATPFEMYVQEDTVLALYRGYGEYVYDEAEELTRWVQTSQVVVIDASDPGSLQATATFEVPGMLSDSRLVGDVLYVVSFEDGYCWDCQQGAPRTSVVSLDVGDPTDVVKVDELSFDERTDAWSWTRSIAVTQERMYVAGPSWGNDGPVGSTIQVVDISHPDGALVLGAEVQVAGQINSRWQMDEFDGTLRVLSQPFSWDLGSAPKLQTYSVASADEVMALGEVSLTLPRPEQLQSARFDGERAYAITFERTDPLITLDLTDPAAPVQAGILEMPGWVYHMQPMGDRLLGLGFDPGAGAGALTVSLFDVSDLATPTMLDRVNFGGEWASFAEDQDRIHKAFNILPEAELILVPFSGFVSGEVSIPYECGSYWQSGIQLIDWSEDTLALRGVAPAKSQARRGFLHQERLFAVSEDRVETFDISDRDEPSSSDSLALAQNVTFTADVGDERVLRVGQDWWQGTTELDVVDLQSVASPTLAGSLEIGADPSTSCIGREYLQGILVDAQRANLIYSSYSWDPSDGKEQQSTRIASVDVSGDAPVLFAETELEFDSGNYYTSYGLVDRGAAQVVVGTTVVVAQTSIDYSGATPVVEDTRLHVIDLADPEDPGTELVELPSGLGSTGLLRSGNVVARSHFEASPDRAGSVRFYLDRVDVSDPSRPEVLPRVNVPGSLLAFDAEQGRAITVDYRMDVTTGVTASECYQSPGARFDPGQVSYDWDTTRGRCSILRYTLNLVEIEDDQASVLGTHDLEDDEQIGQLAAGDDRLLITLTSGYSYGWDGVPVGVGVDVEGSADVAVACYGACGFDPDAQSLMVLSIAGLQSGDFASGRVEIPGGDSWSYSPIAAAGQRAVVYSGWRGQLTVLDLADPQEPSIVRNAEVAGYVQSLSIVGGTAIAALGLDGVQTIELGD